MLELTRVSAHASFLSTISTPPSALYILSLHDALPISRPSSSGNWRRNLPENNQSSASAGGGRFQPGERVTSLGAAPDTPHIEERKSTRLNSSHVAISYAVFSLNKNNSVIEPICVRLCM